MSPQFVDFDNDGQLDIVAGTFDGSPHVALGGSEGWQQPATILDGKGQRIMLNQFWNDEENKWDSTNRCDPSGSSGLAGHLTSAVVWDFDGDGDLDLLLGDYDQGRLFWRVNDGKPGVPEFRARNEVIEAGGEPLSVGKVATMRVLDWDGDGMMDLVVSSIGDSYGDGPGGGVHLFRNDGVAGKPEFAAAVELIGPGPKQRSEEPLRPDVGLYADIADADSDGDLDIVVGGYSMHQEKKRPFIWFYENRGGRKATNASTERR